MSDLKQIVLDAARADAIPEGVAGRWFVRRFNLAAPVDAPRENGKMVTIPAGRFTQLWNVTTERMHLKPPGELVMQDTPDELSTHLDFMLRAKGKVLITGLGLGCVARGCLANPAVDHVTIVERAPEVMLLVSPYMPWSDRLRIIEADAVNWTQTTDDCYDCAWHDLWVDPEIEQGHLQLIHADLIQAMANRVGFQGAWQLPRLLKKRVESLI